MTQLSQAVEALSTWYKSDHRDLPWRNTHDLYAIWLSEIVLQQTRVETVIEYYNRFLSHFPDIASLARADEQTVLKQWEGLGYYSRCRNLHKSAQIIVAEHGGDFPTDIDAVVTLPGIGRSTAGAILTFGDAQRHPLLDGNVKRVLSRFMNEPGDITKAQTLKRLWAHSEALLNLATDAYIHNQAIMEIGARVCLPRSPQCPVCPIESSCESKKAGTQAERPVKPARKKIPHHHIGVGVIWQGETVLIQRRPPEGLLGGLWEFPGGKQEPDESIQETVRREIAEELEIEVSVGDSVAVVRHAYSHFRITLHAYHCQYIRGNPNPKAATDWCWTPLEQLPNYAFPKANKTVLEKLLSNASPT